ncbi:TIM-barrel domain-containing protein [Paenibacillus sp. UNC499MF]|uniref:glycoside hydrolase family 31 protein n=1 Tax=Paenibacillus sp. UNC499MF TaxID=1502751 RepID=UPI00089FA76C|nr:TIM-barrel domain-containing protein [Paenibacillus sp. UNC499MF]SEF62353.1 alpha-glucosidase [Paenibacillus sp. UNC499MF]
MQTSETIHPDKSIDTVLEVAPKAPGSAIRVTEHDDSYIIHGQHANLLLTFLESGLFRIKLFHGSKPQFKAATPAVLADSFQPVKADCSESPEAFEFRTSVLRLIIEKETFALTVETPEGELMMKQPTLSWTTRGSLSGSYVMGTDSHFYGLGEKTSFLDKRGERYAMWNSDVFAPHVPEIEALYESIPMLIHMHQTGSYGLFLDNPGRTDFDMRTHPDLFTIQCTTGEYDLYFIFGPQPKDVVGRYTKLTGRISMPPKWSLGYHQSRYSYMNQQEVLELARTFRERNIPCDVIHLDIHYMDQYRVFTFDKDRFPDPEGMMAELKKLGMRIVPIVDPGVKKDPKYTIYREGIEHGYFCKKLEGELFIGDVWPGKSAFPDFTEDAVGKWWGEKHKFYVDLGITGIWNDMNEPAVFNESKTMDLDVIHGNNGDSKTHEELHNLYGMMMSKATYESLREQLDGERPFVLTRAGYSGVQRYAAVWTGDNRSFWEHMAMAIPMVLNLGLSGIPFTGPDIGGFAHHSTGQLLARWTQMGALFPFCRNHSVIDSVRQEPWSFGEETEAICRSYIELRYRWMPVLYTLFHEASRTGMPILRPLVLEYPHDPQVTNLSDQFLLGSSVLAAPVYRPDTEHRAVYIPEGEWIDYWTGEKHTGPKHILAHAPLHIMPMYIKAGAVLAEEPLKQHADEETAAALTWNVYASAGRAEGTVYEDDGITYGYEQGTYNVIRMSAEAADGGMKLAWTYEHKGLPEGDRSFLIRIKHAEFVPAAVEGLRRHEAGLIAGDSSAAGWAYDEAAGEILIRMPDAPQQVLHIRA